MRAVGEWRQQHVPVVEDMHPGSDNREIVKLRREGRKAALATIINVRGSIPSFQSAKMLVSDDGSNSIWRVSYTGK